ncbi:hypothetical protein AOLI_G00100920 [Acnodon oligacanthus]
MGPHSTWLSHISGRSWTLY